MLRPSHTQTFTAEWASCLPVIPASHSARQGKEKAQQTNATCGHISQTELPLVSPDLCSAKMSKDICPLGLKTFSTTWTNWVTATRQDYLARRKSAQLTEENGCSGWPTPAAHEARLGFQNRNNGKKGSQKSLTTFVIEAGQPVQGNPNTDGKNPERSATPTAAQAEKPQGPNSKQVGLSNQAKWATPEAQNQTGYQTSHGQTFPRLGSQVKQWPTITASDYRTPPTNSGIEGQKVMPSSEHALPKKAGGKLNPNWVEQLMGLDPGRTQLPTEWTG